MLSKSLQHAGFSKCNTCILKPVALCRFHLTLNAPVSFGIKPAAQAIAASKMTAKAHIIHFLFMRLLIAAIQFASIFWRLRDSSGCRFQSEWH
jgi:hypothetical protein